MARKRKAQTEIVPDVVPPAPTQEAQNTPNETPLENQDAEAAVEPSVSPNKKGLKSDVWPFFRREQINGVWKAICKACDKKLGGNTSAGTTHLRDHLRICPLRTKRGPNQALLKLTEQASGPKPQSFLSGNYTFNQNVSRNELAKMIVLHEYPIQMVNHIGFRNFLYSLQPMFKIASRNTMRNDIVKLYESEKAKQMKSLAKNKSRIAITTDMWSSSNQNKGYMVVTAHYIDENWILQNRIIGFIYVPAPHTAEVICDFLVRNLMDWNIDRKLSTLTVDNCTTNDALIGRLFDKIPSYRFILHGELFHMRCCAHILNLIVKDGMRAISSSIEIIRESVGFWVATQKREEKFAEICNQLDMPYTKKLAQDCRTRWNSTYLMLSSALPYEEVFKRGFNRNAEYTCLPSDEDWKMAREICDNLKLFFSVTELFSGTKYPTSNMYFPKICEIKLALRKWKSSSSATIQSMATNMIVKFDKYWGLINGVMAIGAVLDPRYKMSLLNYFFPRIYGGEASKELEKVKKLFEDLIEEYKTNDNMVHTSGETSASTLIMTNLPLSSEDWQKGYLDYVIENASTTSVKSEFVSYLEEGILLDKEKKEIIENFDILGWWKQNGLKFPTMQKIARDFLAIPISTGASESAFSTSGRVLTPQRSRLKEDILEALMCTQDWFRKEMQGSSFSKTLASFECVYEDMDDDDEEEKEIEA